MIKKPYLLIFAMILLSCIALAEDSGGILIAQRNSIIDLPQECPSCSHCYLTKITYPNMSSLTVGALMSKTDTSYNYTFNDTSSLGSYVYCTNCDVDGTNTSACKDFEVTKTGTSFSTSLSLFYLLIFVIVFIFIAISIIGIWKSEGLVAKGLYVVLLYIMLIAFFFSVWDIANKYSTLNFLIWFLRLCFLFLLYSFIPFILLSFFFLITQLRKARGIQQLIEKGVPEDEAIKRIVSRK